MQVIDASVFVDNLLAPNQLLERGELVAPSVVDLEVFGMWRRLMLRGVITASEAREGIDIYSRMKITRHDHLLLLPRIWQFRHEMTAFDAAYVALAEALGAPFLTADRKLARAAERYCEVVVV